MNITPNNLKRNTNLTMREPEISHREKNAKLDLIVGIKIPLTPTLQQTTLSTRTFSHKTQKSFDKN